MPFGSNVRMLTVAVDEDGHPLLGPRMDSLGKLRQVKVEQPPAPEWWNEYLLEEWKRKHHLDQIPRDCRTRWQRSIDEWLRSERVNAYSGVRPGSTGMPKHDVWGAG